MLGDVMYDTRNVWIVAWGDESDRRRGDRVGLPGDREGALKFAHTIVPKKRVMPVILEQNRPWWEAGLRGVPEDNVVEQPLDRGSAPGILAAALRALCRDPDAVLVLLNIDGVRPKRSEVFRAIDLARRDEAIVLLPSASSASRAARVLPVAEAPTDTITSGAVSAVRAKALVDVFQATCPDLVEELSRPDVVESPSTMDLIFPFLPDTDFFEHVLRPVPNSMRMLVA